MSGRSPARLPVAPVVVVIAAGAVDPVHLVLCRSSSSSFVAGVVGAGALVLQFLPQLLVVRRGWIFGTARGCPVTIACGLSPVPLVGQMLDRGGWCLGRHCLTV